MEKEFERERKRTAEAAEGAGTGEKKGVVEMVPTLDGRGRLYDLGSNPGADVEESGPPGKRRKKEPVSFFFFFRLPARLTPD